MTKQQFINYLNNGARAGKLNAVKAIKDCLPQIGLKEAKETADDCYNKDDNSTFGEQIYDKLTEERKNYIVTNKLSK